VISLGTRNRRQIGGLLPHKVTLSWYVGPPIDRIFTRASFLMALQGFVWVLLTDRVYFLA